jgi:hypothetical protein
MYTQEIPMQYIVYKTTNQINGMFYIGTHKTDDLNDDYMGSGKYLRRAIQKYGLKNFKKVVLHVFDNPDEMFSKEAEIVTEAFLSEENTYNLKVGGFGGWDLVNQESPRRLKKNQLGRISANRTIKDRYGVDNPGQLPHNRKASSERMKKLNADGKIKYGNFKDHLHTDATKQKIGLANKLAALGDKNSQFGTMWIMNYELKECMKILKSEPIPDGWVKGRKMSF